MKPVDVRTTNGFSGVFAGQRFSRGDRVLKIDGSMQTYPDRYSIQIGPSLHIEAGPDNPPWKFLNHSCEPNIAMDAADPAFVAVQDIEPGEELRFNYLTTEWDMATPFECQCGSPECFHFIAGFKHLDRDSQRRLLDQAAPHIRDLYSEYLAEEVGTT